MNKFVQIKEVCGEVETDVSVLFTMDSEERLDDHMRHEWRGAGAEEDGSWYVQGDVAFRVYSVIDVPTEDFAVLRKYLSHIVLHGKGGSDE